MTFGAEILGKQHSLPPAMLLQLEELEEALEELRRVSSAQPSGG